VEDHFAKALGDTWLKLKAQQEGAKVKKDNVEAALTTPSPKPNGDAKESTVAARS